MSLEEDDLYARYQTLAALVNVLLHDLRNPLHGSTLIVEAMGSPSADTSALRERLRAQFTKFESVIGEGAQSIKRLAIEAHSEPIALDGLLQSVVERYRLVGAGAPPEFVLPEASTFNVTGDRRLLERAIVEIAVAVAEQELPAGTAPKVTVSLDEPDPATVRLRIGEFGPAFNAANAKTPFTIAGGGIRLAVARALTQNGGGTLRWEPLEGGTARFALLLKKTAAP